MTLIDHAILAALRWRIAHGRPAELVDLIGDEVLSWFRAEKDRLQKAVTRASFFECVRERDRLP